MSDEPIRSSKRVPEPNQHIAEVFFGLIMVLTFTGSLRFAQANRAQVRTVLDGALGCNLAWGIIDGLLYLTGCLSEQGRGIRSWKVLRNATCPPEANRAFADALPPMVAAALGSAEYESIRQKLADMPKPPARPLLGKDEWFGALAVCLRVILTTFPVAIPFIFMEDVARAMRVSEYHPWLTGLVMVVVGTILTGMTMVLGG